MVFGSSGNHGTGLNISCPSGPPCLSHELSSQLLNRFGADEVCWIGTDGKVEQCRVPLQAAHLPDLELMPRLCIVCRGWL